jgi:hypothetical protein
MPYGRYTLATSGVVSPKVPDTSFYLGPFNENMAIAYDYDVISENPLL